LRPKVFGDLFSARRSNVLGRPCCGVLKDDEGMSRFGLDVELEQFKSILLLIAGYFVAGHLVPFSWWWSRL